ncbi:MAG: Gfo/Idh/MocA family oxidoreductase [Planctomycetota bacterium]|nr:Gfo/Idh/MocA family oxidoreductase [Planctomycetota bacterium]
MNRRQFLAVAGTLPAATWFATPPAPAAQVKSPNDRWRIGAIGLRYQGSVITREALAFGDVVALCDVDRHVREQARASFNSAATIYEDYHDLIGRKDLDVVLIGAPDHWHAQMAIDACQAGKDVYVEKPLTLTIAEGQAIGRVVADTGRVVQVGTWQRHDARFRLAAEMVKAGRLGTVKRVQIVLGKNEAGGPFETSTPPKNLNWNRWLGPAPLVPLHPRTLSLQFSLLVRVRGGRIDRHRGTSPRHRNVGSGLGPDRPR